MSQFGFTLPLAEVALVKLASVCMFAVFMPRPPELVALPELVVSQKLRVTLPA